MAIEIITNDNFQTEVLSSAEPTLVEFWAPWCVYCRRLGPVLDRMAQNGTRIGKVNIDEQSALADRFGVDTIPSLFLFRNGQHGEKLVAPSSQAQIEAWMQAQK